MNAKISASTLENLRDKRADELVTLQLQTNTVFTEEIDLLMAWGGMLLYDNGTMATVRIPVGRVNDIAEWDIVCHIR